MRKLLLPLVVFAFASCTKTAANPGTNDVDAGGQASEVDKTVAAASRSNLTAFFVRRRSDEILRRRGRRLQA
jgi:hypothetical protein